MNATTDNRFLGPVPESWSETRARVDDLMARYGELQGVALLEPMIHTVFPGRIAMSSSFGTEAAALLALVAEIDPNLPILFLDTRKLFGETHRYRETLVERLGLSDVRILRPDDAAVSAEDPEGLLFRDDPDRCCALRKVDPLQRALTGYDAWITGRKRFQGGARAALPVIEAAGARIKINPLAGYGRADIEAILDGRDLPRHPLEAEGYASVGCMPCTSRATQGRDGRWAGQEKTECGIHYVI